MVKSKRSSDGSLALIPIDGGPGVRACWEVSKHNTGAEACVRRYYTPLHRPSTRIHLKGKTNSINQLSMRSKSLSYNAHINDKENLCSRKTN